MLFNSPGFLAFFVASFLLLHFVLRTDRSRLWATITLSLTYYGTFGPAFVPLLVVVGGINFLLVRRLAARAEERGRARLLRLTVAFNVVLLLAFWYCGDVVALVGRAATACGVAWQAPKLSIAAPVGIAFYTLQCLSYAFDVYRGSFAPRGGFTEFLASLTFFPHLLAGPILRSSFFIPQLERPRGLQWEAVRAGLILIALGWTKKTIADLLAPTVAAAFGGGPLSPLEAWTGALAFTFQMYGDFSGYTDLATGLALLLGFQLPPNFNLPFVATSPIAFWHRWHISLSTWFRDYVFLPLALIRRRPLQNLMVTMLLTGMWHGPGWSNLAFGLYHGVLLAATQWLKGRFPRAARDPRRWVTVLKIAVTFYLVVIGMVVFRAKTWTSLAGMLRGMYWAPRESVYTAASVRLLLTVVLVLVGGHLLEHLLVHRRLVERRPLLAWSLVTAAVAFCLVAGGHEAPFIYFNV